MSLKSAPERGPNPSHPNMAPLTPGDYQGVLEPPPQMTLPV